MPADEQKELKAERSGNNLTVALINPTSGERTAAEFVRSQLVANLGRANVFDLFPVGRPAVPEAKEFLSGLHPATVILAGGDGTVSLALDILDELRSTNRIPVASACVAVVPMGTGNDLSRTLGFGSGYVKPVVEPEKKFKRRLDQIAHAKRIKMDRWSLLLRKKPALSPTGVNEDGYSRRDSRADADDNDGATVGRKTMMNYFSIGFDAGIANEFSAFRNKHPRLCAQRSLNKLWYGCFACGSLCSSTALPRQQLQLHVDGTLVSLPSGAKALVVTNVTTYAGGAVLWEDHKGRFLAPDVGDGLLEVTALYGVWHAAGVKMGIRKARKVAQGARLRILVPAHLSMQVDGEPMEGVAPANEMIEVSITRLSTTLVMKCEGHHHHHHHDENDASEK
ncbi:diacylglycerol kinase-like protein [Trypanosoma conorhini]|uniref:Diacylglycerol kinase n=1 Tax=Trypanosoma conorhini TaxID=83891 RepID=A0A422PQP4_9TRYP|nr:diacylglycerol kinase-like protein [Trypanosoma conorhini]RNF19827.1 diacylglycerol kinase-like protein [Trypanosoma conorhini]